jgi:cell division protein ZapA
MGEVNVNINGRTFRLGCEDGEEKHLALLAGHISMHIENLKKQLGNVGDDQLYLMAGLMVCDELWDARDKLARAEAALQACRKPEMNAAEPKAAPAKAPPPATAQAQAQAQASPNTPAGNPQNTIAPMETAPSPQTVPQPKPQ